MRLTSAVLLASVSLSVWADVTRISASPKVDGKLDEAVWASASWKDGFQKFGKQEDREVKADTTFAILADDENVYVGIRCREPDMAALKTREPAGIFSKSTDSIEIDLIPDGGTFEYYQFVTTFRGQRLAEFYSEGGNIRPDPYGPEWESAVGEGEGEWTIELRIPLAAFYMTRGNAWRTDWRVNIARAHPTDGFSCWNDLYSSFRELAKFRLVKGFPVRKASEDVCVKTVVNMPSGRDASGKIVGDLELEILSAEAGPAQLTTSFSQPTRITLARGVTTVRVPAVFPENGRLSCTIEILREGAAVPLKRTYPVVVDYQPVRVALTMPQYRNNFYPGQSTDVVKGQVSTSGKEPVELTLTGPGFATRTQKLPSGGGDFAFDTKGFAYGDATLTVVAGADRKEVRIRRLKPLEKGHMTWVENGNLIFDGMPVFRRNMYAEYYRGGEAFKRRYDADDLCQTRDIVRIGTLEVNRLIKGSERKEAIFDRKPSPEIYAALDKVIEQGLSGGPGSYYYISDEPECRKVSPVYLKHVYDYVAERDPYHVILCGSRAGRSYGAVADWFETHPYINPHPDPSGKRIYGREFNTLGSFVDAYRPELHPDKCIGCMPTCFSYGGAYSPDFREYVTHTWNFLVHGVRTYFPYAYHDLGDTAALYEGTRFVNQTAERLADFFLFGERKMLVQTPEVEGAVWTLKDGRKLFALVNCTRTPQKVTVKGLAGTFVEFRGARTFDLFAVQPSTFDLQPLDVLAATSEKADGGLVTYDEMQAKISSLEKERLSRDNQLLGKGNEVVISSGGTKSSGHRKMFDGTRDVIAWSAPAHKPTFYEIAFTKFRPVFREVRVYGWQLDGMQVRVRKDGDWQTLEPTDVKKDEFSVFLTFAEDITTTKLRLEFPKAKVQRELYEIELPRLPGTTGVSPVAPANRPAPPPATTWAFRDLEATQQWSKSVTRDCRWIVFDLASFVKSVDGKYAAWGLYYGGKGKKKLAGDVTSPRLGLYTLPIPSDFGEKESLLLRIYNATIKMPFLVGCDEPADRLSFTEKDGQWTVELHLAAPCEDVTCSLYGSDGRRPVPYAVGGTASVALKPVDAKRTHWQATLTKPSDPPKNRSGKPMHPWAQVEVLGGKLAVPLHTGLLIP